jgi:hypothetical protein
MHKYVLLIIAIGLTTVCKTPAKAQVASIDSLNSNQALVKAIANYDQVTREAGSIYNGTEYKLYELSIKGNAYFLEYAWRKGTLLYDHLNYYGVYLLYDTFKDVVVPQPQSDSFLFRLINEKVGAFSIGTHNFKRVVADTTNNSLETGYYEILYNGKSEVLAKRKKTIQYSSSTEQYFDETSAYYLKQNNTWFKISSKGSELNLLKNKKNELQQYLKKGAVDFKHQKEQAFVQVASYYDQITN